MSMPDKIGEIEALFRYPVKSMRGETLDAAELGWHGLEGDRRLALQRVDDYAGFPWLTATKLPELILFTPERKGSAQHGLPTHVRSPEGKEMEIFGDELAMDVSDRHGSPVQMLHLNRGIFDETSISVMTLATATEIGRLAAQPPDVRRFRPNIVVSALRQLPFEEDEWIGGTLSFGNDSDAAAINITMRDERCAMVNYHPDTGRPASEMLKTIVRLRDNKAGVYATVSRPGLLKIGQPIFFQGSQK
jgi:uncharacterized protein